MCRSRFTWPSTYLLGPGDKSADLDLEPEGDLDARPGEDLRRGRASSDSYAAFLQRLYLLNTYATNRNPNQKLINKIKISTTSSISEYKQNMTKKRKIDSTTLESLPS